MSYTPTLDYFTYLFNLHGYFGETNNSDSVGSDKRGGCSIGKRGDGGSND